MHMNDLMARALAGALIGLAAVPGGKEAWAQQRTTIQLTLKNHRFEPAEPHAPAGQPLIIPVSYTHLTLPTICSV